MKSFIELSYLCDKGMMSNHKNEVRISQYHLLMICDQQF